MFYPGVKLAFPVILYPNMNTIELFFELASNSTIGVSVDVSSFEDSFPFYLKGGVTAKERQRSLSAGSLSK